MKSFLYTCLTLCMFTSAQAQETEKYTWHDPSHTLTQLEGQGWSNLGYYRLPEKAKSMVREPVWKLSRNAAGLSILFATNADDITVEYTLKGGYGMNHMPPTGVSGVDLYVKDKERWLWCRGRFQFKDTVRYRFKIDALSKKVKEYQLFLPLYNTIEHLRIGISEQSTFNFLPKSNQRPIVVYGTSIAQGACASRPGMAWTSILSRKLDQPVVNLGFSGNGRLEPDVISFLTEIDASIFVLDCLPNLSPNENTYQRRNTGQNYQKCGPAKKKTLKNTYSLGTTCRIFGWFGRHQEKRSIR